jgi:hypothetical protein
MIGAGLTRSATQRIDEILASDRHVSAPAVKTEKIIPMKLRKTAESEYQR